VTEIIIQTSSSFRLTQELNEIAIAHMLVGVLLLSFFFFYYFYNFIPFLSIRFDQLSINIGITSKWIDLYLFDEDDENIHLWKEITSNGMDSGLQ
jgi:hypothetical protein